VDHGCGTGTAGLVVGGLVGEDGDTEGLAEGAGELLTGGVGVAVGVDPGAGARVVAGAGVVAGGGSLVAVGVTGRRPTAVGSPVAAGTGTGEDSELEGGSTVGALLISVGTGSPGALGAGVGAELGRSTAVAPTKASTTTAIPATAPTSAIRRRRPVPPGTSTYRLPVGSSRPATRSRSRARPSFICPLPRRLRGPSRSGKGYHDPLTGLQPPA